MLRILHIYKVAHPKQYGGVSSVIEEIAQACKEGFQHTVLALHKGKQIERLSTDCYQAVFVPQRLELLSTPLSYGFVRELRALAKQHDLIHYHFPFPLAEIAQPLAKAKPSIATYHSDIVKQKVALHLYRPLMHRFLANMDRIVATSDNYRKSSPVLKRYPVNTETIPLGIREPSRASAGAVERWKHKVGSDFFLFIGALRYYKGLEFLLEAARLTDLPIVVAGKGELGVLQRNLETTPNIQFLGEIDQEDKLALLSLAQAFVFPSHRRSEAFGVSLVEAAAFGLPMISTEIGTGTSFVNLDKVTGLVIPPSNGQALAEAMLRLNTDAELRAQYGQAARQRYERLFTAEAMGRAYARVYRDVLEKT